MNPSSERCPCGSKKKFSDCCSPYLAGTREAPTAEALMRSRYSAYAKINVPYILRTRHPSLFLLGNEAQISDWAHHHKWLKLEVVKTSAGKATDQKGTVEFKAWFEEKEVLYCLHEHSRFEKVLDKWVYVDGEYPSGQPKQVKDLVRGNDSCPCGSGKKFKKCHG